MDFIRGAVDELRSAVQEQSQQSQISQGDLESSGLRNVHLRDYQIYGVNWLAECFAKKRQQGCILGDEMGLGKTLQSIAFILSIKNLKKRSGPCLVLCPLSVLGNWEQEFTRFSPALKLFVYVGDKHQREELRSNVTAQFGQKASKHYVNVNVPFDVCVTTYEICLKDASFLRKFQWRVLIVDEAHRLKNHKSLLYQELTTFDFSFRLLLTGTPVQNNLNEVYSLLAFISPKIFDIEHMEEFVNHYQDICTGSALDVSEELHSILKPFLLRRLKSEVVLSLPKKSEVVLSIGMSALQKKLYKAILTKDIAAFSTASTNRTSLLNILMQLRKCCNHPYVFPGIEPEPFEIGEHLVKASGKLHVLDILLSHLKLTEHRVLIFSQFTTMLDIVQDYLTYRGYTYERLDGSVRGEERYLAINNFNESDEIFAFLLSTKAGGQGLNLMSADTVVFLDNDFNPQNDLQAAARAHRIGQTRPVKVIRLVTKNSVEEIVLRRAERKMKLTNAVVEGGQFSNLSSSMSGSEDELKDLLKFGLEHLLESDDDDKVSANLLSALGGSCNGLWLLEEDVQGSKEKMVDLEEENMYVFEGHDYSKETSDADHSAFKNLVESVLSSQQASDRSSRTSRQVVDVLLSDIGGRKRRPLTEEEKEARRQKRLENVAKKAKLLEEEELRKAQRKKERREKLWKDHGYNSCNITLNESDEEEEEEIEDSLENLGDFLEEGESDDRGIHYVLGDVTLPVNTGDKDAIIVHCVDDSGSWGSGGVFSALAARSGNPQSAYELAAKMKDLSIGDAHLVPVDDQISRACGSDLVALVVAQTRDRNNKVSQVHLAALGQGLRRIAREAKRRKASVHLPRLGHSTPNFNWYGTEKLIKKELAWRNIPTSVYYYPRKKFQAQPKATSEAQTKESLQKMASTVPPLPDIFSGVVVYFSEFPMEDIGTLKRYIVAYDGDVADMFNEDVTHVIVSTDNDIELGLELKSHQKIIRSEWIETSIRNKRLMEEETYLADLQRTKR